MLSKCKSYENIFSGSVMANLANFPEKYIGHMSSGQGMGGLLPSVVNVIILAFPNSNSQVGDLTLLTYICTYISSTYCIRFYHFLQCSLPGSTPSCSR